MDAAGRPIDSQIVRIYIIGFYDK